MDLLINIDVPDRAKAEAFDVSAFGNGLCRPPLVGGDCDQIAPPIRP